MRALSLEYHDVVRDGVEFDRSGFPGPGPASYKLTLTEFERHLDAIAQGPVRPSRATDWLAGDTLNRPLFITFDDGGLGANECIAGALERRGWFGHFFITGSRIGSPTFLSPTQLRELRDRGHVIGAHSYTHPARMGACGRQRIREEWVRSVAVLEDILGGPVLSASVPGGLYTPPVAEEAARAGLRLLFTSTPTSRYHVVDECRVMGRYTLRRWSTSDKAASLASGEWVACGSQWALYGCMNLARRIGGDYYTRVRERFWTQR